MKARVKATGEIMDIFFHDCNKEGICFYYTEDYEMYAENEIEIIQTKDPNYWENLKHRYAGMAMQGMLESNISADDIAYFAVKYATALVEKLKEEKK